MTSLGKQVAEYLRRQNKKHRLMMLVNAVAACLWVLSTYMHILCFLHGKEPGWACAVFVFAGVIGCPLAILFFVAHLASYLEDNRI